MWSQWSDLRSFKVTVPSFGVEQDQIIEASHYNYIKDLVTRIVNTYGVIWTNAPTVIKNNTIILRSQYYYDVLSQRLVDVKNQVNNYGVYTSDKNNIKLDSTNDLPESFTTQEEIVTAEGFGNYMLTVYERTDFLK